MLARARRNCQTRWEWWGNVMHLDSIHELLRTHPLIDLPSLLAAQQEGHPSAESQP